jgi:hypothetical protein
MNLDSLQADMYIVHVYRPYMSSFQLSSAHLRVLPHPPFLRIIPTVEHGTDQRPIYRPHDMMLVETCTIILVEATL